MTRNARSPWRLLLIVIAALTLAWLATVLYLDFAYSMFPRVLLGGLKILLAGYAVFGLIALPLFVLQRIVGRKTKS